VAGLIIAAIAFAYAITIWSTLSGIGRTIVILSPIGIIGFAIVGFILFASTDGESALAHHRKIEADRLREAQEADRVAAEWEEE